MEWNFAFVPDALQEKYSDLITQHLKETKSPAAYNKYHFYVYDKNDIATTFFKIDEDNPFFDDLVKQTDPALNKTINKYGCSFMAAIAFPQLLAGNIMKASEVQKLWNNSGSYFL